MCTIFSHSLFWICHGKCQKLSILFHFIYQRKHQKDYISVVLPYINCIILYCKNVICKIQLSTNWPGCNSLIEKNDKKWSKLLNINLQVTKPFSDQTQKISETPFGPILNLFKCRIYHKCLRLLVKMIKFDLANYVHPHSILF